MHCRRISPSMKFASSLPICAGAAAANPWLRESDALPRGVRLGTRGRKRGRARLAQFESDHFQVAHHPVNNEPRDDVKAAHTHQHPHLTTIPAPCTANTHL